MTELGKLLQQTRKKKKYSFEKIHSATRISQRYIKALEESDSKVFSAEFYHRSTLKNYAKFLGLDINEVLKLYEQEKNEIQYDLFSDDEINKQKKDNKKSSSKSVNKTNDVCENKNESKENKIKKWFSQSYFVKLISIIILCVVFVGLLIIINIFVSKKVPTKTNVQDNSAPVVAIVNTNDSGDDNIKEEPVKPVPAPVIKKETTKQLLDIEALKDTWIRVFSDGNQIFEGILLSGQQQTCFANNSFTIKIGNVENLKISFNGKPVDINVGAKEDKTNTLTFKKDN